MNNVVDLGTEKRITAADEARDASKWTPRDVLVDVLRRIDSGEYKPETLAVVWTETAGSGGIKPRYSIAVADDNIPGFYHSLFLSDVFKRMVIEDATS